MFLLLTTYFLAYLIVILTSDYLCIERFQVIFFYFLFSVQLEFFARKLFYF